MAFPTTSILTTFAGGVENPISEGGTWASTGTALTGSGDAQRNGSGGMDGNGSNCEMKRTETTGPACEVYATVSTASGGFLHLYAKLSGSNYYRLDKDSSDIWRFYKTGDVQIGANLATQALSNGDAVGFEYISDGTLRAYRKPAAGSWAQMGTDRSDTDLLSATGNLAMALTSTMVFDDFGGGTLGGAPIGDGFMMYSQWG